MSIWQITDHVNFTINVLFHILLISQHDSCICYFKRSCYQGGLREAILPDCFGFFWGTGPSPSNLLWTLSTSLPRPQPSLVLLSMQDKTEGEFFLQSLRTPSIELSSSLSGLSCIWATPACHLWHYFFHFWSRPWGVVRLMGFCGLVEFLWCYAPLSFGRDQVTPPSTREANPQIISNCKQTTLCVPLLNKVKHCIKVF